MKMLFFSSEKAEIEQVRKEFVDAGIACEIHENDAADASAPNPSDTELWIKNDGDSYRALLLCVKLGVGFAQRTLKTGYSRIGE